MPTGHVGTLSPSPNSCGLEVLLHGFCSRVKSRESGTCTEPFHSCLNFKKLKASLAASKTHAWLSLPGCLSGLYLQSRGQLLFPAFPLEKAKAQLCPIDFYPALGSFALVSSINFNFPSGREPLAEVRGRCSLSVNPALWR